MSKTKTTTTDRLAKLEGDARRMAEHAQDIRIQARDARDAVEAIEDALATELRALALKGQETSPKADELEADLETAKAKAAEPWQRRVDAAEQAGRELSARASAFVNDHLRELLDELRPDAEQARAALAQAAREWELARRDYLAVRDGVHRLLGRVQAIDTQSLPSVSFTPPQATVPGFTGAHAVDLDELPLPFPSDAAMAVRQHFHEHGVLPPSGVKAGF
jgi:hypothetical protein